jgi:hypothetical protein
MSGFNLPPGCNVSDIPGNRPGDDAAEAFENAMCSRFDDVEKLLQSTSSVDQLLYNLFVKVADWAYRKGVDDGYADGKADQYIANDLENSVATDRREKLIFDLESHIDTLKSLGELCRNEAIAHGSSDKMGKILHQQQEHLDNMATLVENLDEL